MPSWITEDAEFERLSVGQSYSKLQAAEALSVPPPRGSRDWGGLVGFRNGTALFITLEKGADRYAEEHRYDDQFEGNLLYWDSRAYHDKNSKQVRALRTVGSSAVVFARLREKTDGRTRPFIFLGRLQFEDWWGEKPVHFTWRLEAFPNELGGTKDLIELAEWRPPLGRIIRAGAKRPPVGGASGVSNNRGNTKEGSRVRVFANRYERDPRARLKCLEFHGTACLVCGFDFQATYGELGVGFIIVHHRIPVAIRAAGGEYELDPVRDLVPICGNCHAMVHRPVEVDGALLISPSLPPEAASRLIDLRRLAAGEPPEADGTDD